ncbi:MAG: hypothetical protein HY606_13195 [Planctomycetes bacterium]|nr:hypothetical protein [Planctomycetota bacterium]
MGNVKMLLDQGKIINAVNLTKELIDKFPTSENVGFFTHVLEKYGLRIPLETLNLQTKKPAEKLIRVNSKGRYELTVIEGNKTVNKEITHKNYVMYKLKNGQRVLINERTLICLDGKNTVYFFNGMTMTTLKDIMFTVTKVFRNLIEIWLAPAKEEAAKSLNFTMGKEKFKRELKVGQVVILTLTRDSITQRMGVNFDQKNFAMQTPNLDMLGVGGAKEIFILVGQKDLFLKSVDFTDIKVASPTNPD